MTSSLRLPALGPHEQQIYYNTYTPVPSVFSWPRVGDAPVSGERKRPIAARTLRAAAALSTVQPVASEATPALSLRFTRERRPEPVPMCVSCGGGREGPPRSALRRSPELASPLRAKARSPCAVGVSCVVRHSGPFASQDYLSSKKKHLTVTATNMFSSLSSESGA